MEPPEQEIGVGPDDGLAALLARLEAARGRVVVHVPREARVPRTIEDFQAIRSLARRRSLYVQILTPVASIVGLAKIYGLDAEFAPEVMALPAPTPVPDDQFPDPRPPLSALGLTPGFLPPVYPPVAIRPLPSPELPSESDWLLGGLDLESIESASAHDQGRSAAPPDPAAPPAPPADLSWTPPSAAQPSAPIPYSETASETDWLLGGLDLDTMDAALTSERGRSSAPPGEARPAAPIIPTGTTPVAPPPSSIVEVPQTATPNLPAGSFLGARSPLEDENFLPDWLRAGSTLPVPGPTMYQPPVAAPVPVPTPTPDPPAPLPPPMPPPAPRLAAHGPAPAPGPRWVVPCPHCGVDMDFEALRALAEYRE